MFGRRIRSAALWLPLMVAVALGTPSVAAQEIGHYGTNQVTFERDGPVPDDARGKGIIDYRGGDEPDSRWRASFKFNDLRENRQYTVVAQGRFGADGSDEARQFTAICSFDTNDNGKGSCFRYFEGLARLDVLQLRVGDEDGTRAMQAERRGGDGAIETDPNRYSPGGMIPEREPEKAKAKRRSRS
jgi:hypothetical protein